MDEAKADIKCLDSSKQIPGPSGVMNCKSNSSSGLTTSPTTSFSSSSSSSSSPLSSAGTSSSTSPSSSSTPAAQEPDGEIDLTKKLKFTKKIQLPIEQILSLNQLKGLLDIQSEDPEESDTHYGLHSKNFQTNLKKIKHNNNEFYFLCKCSECLEYREMIVLMMDDQMKTRSTWEILQTTIKKAYQPILKNASSLAKYEIFLASEGASWHTTGNINHIKALHLNFICDLTLTENMMAVLLSALLLVDDPHQLFELMAFQVECVVKAYLEGFVEVMKTKIPNKIPAEVLLSYVLDGYDELCSVADSLSRFLFAFENNHLKKFSLTWTMLNKRMYQQHVYVNLTDTMLACIIALKEKDLTKKHSELIKKYIQFDDEMIQIDRSWKETWVALNKYNLSEDERNRRLRLKAIKNQFNVIRNDFSLACSNPIDIADWPTHKNREGVWVSMLAYVLSSRAEYSSVHLNTLVCDDKCVECNEMLEYHAATCKCVTCAIAGGPLPPKKSPNSTCMRCLTMSRAEKDGSLYESKLLTICASDDLFVYKSKDRRRTNSLEDLSDTSSLSLRDDVFNDPEEWHEYHLAWAVFKHLKDRKPYIYSKIDEKYFCVDCKSPPCLVAKKILNNEIALALSWHLIQHYQPLNLSHNDLTVMLRNIRQYNRKIASSKARVDPQLDDEVFKIYWAFEISVIACYFVEFEGTSAFNLNYFELANNDIQLIKSRLKGAEKDGKFFQFLEKISGLTAQEKEIKETKRTYECLSDVSSSPSSPDRLPVNAEEVRTPESEPPEPETPTKFFPPKKCGKDKTKKCCFDHPEVGDHCKENHASKKRIRKECNHARMNETRDRLRKKLSQLVNARKNVKTPASKLPSQSQPQQPNNKPQFPSEVEESNTSEAKSAPTAAVEDDDDSLECLNTLCKRITHQPNKQTTTNTKKTVSQAPVSQTQLNQPELPSQPQEASPPTSATGTKKQSNLKQALSPEIFAMLENAQEFNIKKWVNETLSFIEGSNDTKGPVNEKKAAKKAKQKQRKEEMKRILELQDQRCQFHDIYFKEFAAKNELKYLKTFKKKDKKKIAEFEANIKKLNRAKAKVETTILELIATIKQTNTEFKFPYLPTKEQQVEKLRELSKDNNESCILTQPPPPPPPPPLPSPQSPINTTLPTATILPPHENNLNGGSFYSIPYANSNNFPPFVMPNLVSTPNVQMCYAPNQPTDMTDPSKRIVTIRRVNLPNVPEPQVTVTAKGSSPDKDKLLYTFVNGQIIQTGQQPPPTSPPPMTPASPVEKLEKTKTQLKKERKRAKKLAEAEERQIRLAREEQLLKEEEQRKKEQKEKEALAKTSKKTNKKKNSITTSKPDNKAANRKPKAVTPVPSVSSSSLPTTRENSVCSQNPKPKQGYQSRGNNSYAADDTDSRESERQSNGKDREKRQKFVDNGQFDNNQFKMLHLDDFMSSDSTESDTDEPETMCEVVKPANPPKSKPVDKPLPVVTSTTNNTATNNENIPQKTQKSQEPKSKPQQQLNQVYKTTPSESTEKIKDRSAEHDRDKEKERGNPTYDQTISRKENRETTNSRTIKPSAHLASSIHDRSNDGKRNKPVNGPSSARRQSSQIQSNYGTQQVPSQRDSLIDNSKRSRKIKNKCQPGSYANNSTDAVDINLKPRRNPPVIHSSGNSKIDSINSIQQPMQNLRLTPNNYPQLPANQQQQQQHNQYHQHTHAHQTQNHQYQHLHDRPSSHYYQQNHTNISIMDQLNRGVQVENLSLPPGITLTKVDPSKSEQLRAKSESIKKLAKPLSHVNNTSPNVPQSTIIAPSLFPHISHYASPNQTGVIMVEAMGGAGTKQNNQNPSNDAKVSKNKKRRNKKKTDTFRSTAIHTPRNTSNGDDSSQPKMVTLRNPLFGNMLQQNSPSVVPLANRLPIAPVPMDQPASIIKNENGMFTIRNPALQAAVANGLPVASYRQFTGNYYTPPQENIGASNNIGNSSLSGNNLGNSFSYFSNNNTCSSPITNSQQITVDPFSSNNGYSCDLGDNTLRPKTSGKCISAIGSEIKTAQQLKQRSKESLWQNFSTHDSTSVQDNACNYLGSSLQSNYYNGYDVFSSSSGGSQQVSSSGSLFETNDCPIHHNCDDSPPPTISGYSHYLNDIPNTGIIRYDDASFLKTLMPGQNLNNEVSIHNVSESNFSRAATSPVAHRVEITPVYGNRSSNLFTNCSDPTQYSPGKGYQPHNHLGATDYTENMFSSNTLLNLNDLDSNERDIGSYNKRYGFDFQQPKDKEKMNININDLFMKSENSSRSSPYLDDSTMMFDGLVKNLSAMKLTEDQRASVNGNINTAGSPNGWW